MLLLLACFLDSSAAVPPTPVLAEEVEAPVPVEPAFPHLSTAEARARYAETRAVLKSRRAELAAAGRGPDVLEEARATLFQTLRGGLLPAWFGTPWDFNGISAVPGEGVIACGYLVSTVLQHAGLRVERYRLAQQASEHIVRTFTPPDALIRLRLPRRGEVAAALLRDGLYVVGLDHHVGFLSRETVGGVPRVEFCHASYVGTVAVACEPLDASPGFASSSYVVGELLTDANLRTWLDGVPFVTSRPVGSSG